MIWKIYKKKSVERKTRGSKIKLNVFRPNVVFTYKKNNNVHYYVKIYPSSRANCKIMTLMRCRIIVRYCKFQGREVKKNHLLSEIPDNFTCTRLFCHSCSTTINTDCMTVETVEPI